MKRFMSFLPRSPLCQLVLILLALLAAETGCSPNDDPERATMPSFTLASVEDGSEINSDEFADQALLVNFFATWCPPCRQEVPVLVDLQDKYGDDDFTVLAISVDQGDTQKVRDFMAELGINYPVVMSAADTPQNFGDVYGIPTSFIINRQGEIVERFEGHVEMSVLESKLQAII